MYHDSSGLFEVMSAGERKGAQADTDGYRKSNAFGVAAGELGKQSAKESTFQISVFRTSLCLFFRVKFISRIRAAWESIALGFVCIRRQH